jgi:hypothetical protein
MKPRLAAWRDVIVTTFKNWFAHDSMAESAALAYYTVFSLAPVLLVVVTIAGAVFGPDAVRGRIVHQFGGLMGEEHAQMIQTILQKTQQEKASGLATAVGIVTLLFGATAVFAQLQSSLDRIWEVKPKPGTSSRISSESDCCRLRSSSRSGSFSWSLSSCRRESRLSKATSPGASRATRSGSSGRTPSSRSRSSRCSLR